MGRLTFIEPRKGEKEKEMEKNFELELIRKNVRLGGNVIATLTYLGTNQRFVVSLLIQCNVSAYSTMLVEIMNSRLIGLYTAQAFIGANHELMSVVRFNHDRHINSPNNFLRTFARKVGKACEEKAEGWRAPGLIMKRS